LRSATIATRLTEHDDVVKSLLRGAPHLGLALGPASARAGPGPSCLINLVYSWGICDGPLWRAPLSTETVRITSLSNAVAEQRALRVLTWFLTCVDISARSAKAASDPALP